MHWLLKQEVLGRECHSNAWNYKHLQTHLPKLSNLPFRSPRFTPSLTSSRSRSVRPICIYLCSCYLYPVCFRLLKGHCFMTSSMVWRALYLIMPENSTCKPQRNGKYEKLGKGLGKLRNSNIANLTCAWIEGSDLAASESESNNNCIFFRVHLEVFESSGVQNRGRTPELWRLNILKPFESCEALEHQKNGWKMLLFSSFFQDLVSSSMCPRRMVEHIVCRLWASDFSTLPQIQWYLPGHSNRTSYLTSGETSRSNCCKTR